MKFEGEEFKEFSEYVMNCFKPATEMAIRVTDESIMYNWLNEWFNFLENPEYNGTEIPDNYKVNIGPFIGIQPYSYFKTDATRTEDDKEVEVYEFLFLYDSIDRSKITMKQLSLGRDDFVDLWQK